MLLAAQNMFSASLWNLLFVPQWFPKAPPITLVPTRCCLTCPPHCMLMTQTLFILLTKMTVSGESVSNHHVGNSVAQFCTCDLSVCCICCIDTNDGCHLHCVSLKHGYKKGILSYTSVYARCQFLCLHGSRVKVVVNCVMELPPSPTLPSSSPLPLPLPSSLPLLATLPPPSPPSPLHLHLHLHLHLTISHPTSVHQKCRVSPLWGRTVKHRVFWDPPRLNEKIAGECPLLWTATLLDRPRAGAVCAWAVRPNSMFLPLLGTTDTTAAISHGRFCLMSRSITAMGGLQAPNAVDTWGPSQLTPVVWEFSAHTGSGPSSVTVASQYGSSRAAPLRHLVSRADHV